VINRVLTSLAPKTVHGVTTPGATARVHARVTGHNSQCSLSLSFLAMGANL